MSRDVYQPCPFCTDKKIKFCCADIADDMSKIMRQVEGGQQRTALKRLEKLAETHPDTVWNQTARAMVLLEEDRDDEALAILEHLHAKHPDHAQVAGLHTGAALRAGGYRAARDLLWRALRKAHAPADMLCTMLCHIAAELITTRCYLAARQYLTVAMRLASDEERQSIFMGLMEFDSDTFIPYPLRGVHSLRSINGDAEREETAHKASRLAERGCFGPAADRYAALAEAQSGDAAAEYNTALCRAWAGDQLDAAAAFIRAARAESDFELAAEYAALGQLLRTAESEDALNSREASYQIDSVDRVIAALDELPVSIRRPIPPAESNEMTPDGAFELTDRTVPDSYADLEPRDCPRRLGYCIVQGPTAKEHAPQLRLVCDRADDFDTCWKIISECVGPDADAPIQDVTKPLTRLIPRGFDELLMSIAVPASVSMTIDRRLRKQLVEELVESWLATPQELLDGRTPTDAARQPDWQAETAGLLYLLDVAVYYQRLDVDPGIHRARLGLPEITRTSPESDQSLHSFSTIQMHRVRVQDLDDRQLSIVMNRALLIQHGLFLNPVLLETLERDLPGIDKQRIFTTLTKLARDRGDVEESLRWIDEARRGIRPSDNAFLETAEWDLREFALRLEQGDSPEFQEYLRDLVSYYRPKLPDVVEIIAAHVVQMGIEMPAIQTAGTRPAGQPVWTPDQPASTGQKLWLPGS